MKIILNSKDKLRIRISVILLVIGLLMIAALIAPYFNTPPQCPLFESQADIGFKCTEASGVALIWMIGVPVAIAGCISLIGSLLYALAAKKPKK